MSKEQRYMIVNNESGDDYYIPVEKEPEWFAWLYSEAWENGDTPEWAGVIDGHFTFTDPRSYS